MLMFDIAHHLYIIQSHREEVDALGALDVLAKTPGLYLVPELRYP